MLDDFTLNHRTANISKRKKIFFLKIDRFATSMCQMCNEVLILINVIVMLFEKFIFIATISRYTVYI